MESLRRKDVYGPMVAPLDCLTDIAYREYLQGQNNQRVALLIQMMYEEVFPFHHPEVHYAL